VRIEGAHIARAGVGEPHVSAAVACACCFEGRLG
jgi:hypothetical protein